MTEPGGHLSESIWEKLACDELSEQERAAAFDHIGACVPCSKTWEALREVRAAAADFDPYLQEHPEEVLQRGRLWSRGPALGLAATLMAVAGLWLWSARPEAIAPVEPGPIERSQTSTSPHLESPAEGARGDFSEFRWAGTSTADRYVVELLRGDGEPLWTSETSTASSVPWPNEIERSPGEYYWRVVVLSNGQSTASPLVRFELIQ